MLRFSLIPLSFLLITSAVQAEQKKYVTDNFEVTLRSGTSTANSIVSLLRSGAVVTLLESDPETQYSLVQTEDGKQGYVLSRFLIDEPVARSQLEDLQQSHAQQSETVAAQTGEIDQLRQSLEQEQSDTEALKTALRASEQELSQVREAAQNALNILEQNERLQTMVEQLREEKTALSASNAELSDSTRMDWFVRGAGVSLVAFVIGILVTRIRWRKQDSWGSY